LDLVDAASRRSHYRSPKTQEWGDSPRETFLEALAVNVREKPDGVFLDYEGKTLTFREIDIATTRMANALAKLGVTKGATVATLLDNSDDSITIWFAINKLGAIWVPINTAYRGSFLSHQLADSGAHLAICEAHYTATILAIAGQTQLTRLLLRNGSGDQASGHVDLQPLDDHRGDDDTPIDVTVTPEDIACLIYTSGTTGPSKGCMESHSCLCSIARRRNRSVVPIPGEITWSCLPLFHIASLSAVILGSLLAGERVAIGARFSVSGFWDEIERSKATSAMLLATMLPLLAHAPDTPAMHRCRGQLRVVTGVPLSAGDRKIWEERFGVGFMNTFAYGQTEANMVSYLPWGEPDPPLESMGRASDDFEVMVADDDGLPVPIGEPGEFLLRPLQPGVMFSGYWRKPDDTLKAMKDFWWHTGDLVKMDKRGFLYFIDRKKDFLRSRGENISSFEVETAFTKHEALHEVACHAVNVGAGLEEDIKLTAVIHAGAKVTEREIFDWALENLPYFAVPRYIEFRSELPKTPTGRVQKQELRVQGRTAATWDSVEAGLVVRRPKLPAAS
jgi:crotonobetaine/carnitine-CoA ligase